MATQVKLTQTSPQNPQTDTSSNILQIKNNDIRISIHSINVPQESTFLTLNYKSETKIIQNTPENIATPILSTNELKSLTKG